MNLRTGRVFLAAGALLIVAANVIVFLGVMFNRHSPAESTLLLTERELSPSVMWSFSNENSGLNLQLDVRMPSERSGDSNEGEAASSAFIWGGASWLSAEKLRSLGFPIVSTQNSDEDHRRDEKLMPRDVYVVLELNGKSYQRELQGAQLQAARDALSAQADPEDKVLAERAKGSREQAEAVQNQLSRLYCIDAGVDPVALRKIYSDRTQFAIVRGTVRPWVYEKDHQWRIVGTFSGLRIPQLNVPRIYRPVFGARRNIGYVDAIATAIAGPARNQKDAPHFNVSVAWGHRFEPWMLSAATLIDDRGGERQ